MIKIKRNDDILLVSKGTYKTIFEKIGYEIVEEGAVKVPSQPKKEVEKQHKVEDETDELENILSIGKETKKKVGNKKNKEE